MRNIRIIGLTLFYIFLAICFNACGGGDGGDDLIGAGGVINVEGGWIISATLIDIPCDSLDIDVDTSKTAPFVITQDNTNVTISASDYVDLTGAISDTHISAFGTDEEDTIIFNATVSSDGNLLVNGTIVLVEVEPEGTCTVTYEITGTKRADTINIAGNWLLAYTLIPSDPNVCGWDTIEVGEDIVITQTVYDITIASELNGTLEGIIAGNLFDALDAGKIVEMSGTVSPDGTTASGNIDITECGIEGEPSKGSECSCQASFTMIKE
jgi:hypothetical protein